MFDPFCSTEVIFTDRQGLLQQLADSCLPNTLLVMSHAAEARWQLSDWMDTMRTRCRDAGGSFLWIDQVPANPTQRSLAHALQSIAEAPVDLVIAWGGGSAIDLAKGISALHDDSNHTVLDEYTVLGMIQSKSWLGRKIPPVIAVPTTAGTGSEVTQWATIWDANMTDKYSLDHASLKPARALIVPELTLTLPASATLSAGLDAFSQAIEAYWSRYTTPLVQDLAIRAVDILLTHLREAIDHPDSMPSREMVSRAALLAGLAFSRTRTTACHAISYPLTQICQIPHGLAAAMTLAPVAAVNHSHYPGEAMLTKLFEPYGGLGTWLDQTRAGVAPLRLSEYGVQRVDLGALANRAIASGRIDNNPVQLTADDVLQILIQVL